MAGPCSIPSRPTSGTQSGSGRPKMRPVRKARAFGPSVASSVCPVTTVASGASTHPDLLHHSVHQVWLAILLVGHETDKTVFSGREIHIEGPLVTFIQPGNSTEWLSRRGSLHPSLGPPPEVFHLLARSQLQQDDLMCLRAGVLDPDGMPARSECLGKLKIVIQQFHGDVSRRKLG